MMRKRLGHGAQTDRFAQLSNVDLPPLGGDEGAGRRRGLATLEQQRTQRSPGVFARRLDVYGFLRFA
jgi:hypothetical protein